MFQNPPPNSGNRVDDTPIHPQRQSWDHTTEQGSLRPPPSDRLWDPCDRLWDTHTPRQRCVGETKVCGGSWESPSPDKTWDLSFYLNSVTDTVRVYVVKFHFGFDSYQSFSWFPQLLENLGKWQQFFQSWKSTGIYHFIKILEKWEWTWKNELSGKNSVKLIVATFISAV